MLPPRGSPLRRARQPLVDSATRPWLNPLSKVPPLQPPPHIPLLGRVVSLTIRRFGPPGAFLVEEPAADAPTILLPGAEIPDGAQEGDALTVFIYLDSEDRPVATTREPK